MPVRSKQLASLLTLALLSMAFAACSEDGSNASSSPDDDGTLNDSIHVLAIVPLTGPLGPTGEANVIGLEAAAAVLSRDGGCMGAKIEIESKDDAGSATEAVAILQDVIASGDSPDFLLAGSTSTETVPLAALASQNKIVTASAAGAAELNDPEGKYSYHFADATSGPSVAEALSEVLKRDGVQSVAALVPNNVLGIASDSEFKAEGQEAGVSYSSEFVDPAAVDATPQMLNLQKSNPDALVVTGFGPIAAAILQTRNKIGWDIPTYGDSRFAGNDLVGVVGEDAVDGVQLVTLQSQIVGSPLTKTSNFQTMIAEIDSLAERSDTGAFFVYESAYSSLMAYCAAAAKAKSVDPSAVKEAWETLGSVDDIPNWVGPKTPGYSPTNHFDVYTPEDFLVVSPGPFVGGQINGTILSAVE
jgi:ABC-type branched-subunit amino acid transport system substrate-binding protein